MDERLQWKRKGWKDRRPQFEASMHVLFMHRMHGVEVKLNYHRENGEWRLARRLAPEAEKVEKERTLTNLNH